LHRFISTFFPAIILIVEMIVTQEAMEALALKMMKAAQDYDFDTLRDCYTPDATLWLNITGATLRAEDHLNTVKTVTTQVRNLRHENIRVRAIPGGYVQQHRTRGELPNGKTYEVHACFVVEVRDGKIAHRAEYIDSAAVAAVREFGFLKPAGTPETAS
jgi:uncharacterized protein